MNNNYLNIHAEMMAMSAEELEAWLEEVELAETLNPTDIDSCPWILMPSTISAKIPQIGTTNNDAIVPIKWTMGNVAWYIVEYDGDDTVYAYLSDSEGLFSEKTQFVISTITDLTLFSDKQTWRVYRDINWNPNTKLSDIMPNKAVSSFDETDDELVF